jgi:hypothetical protein
MTSSIPQICFVDALDTLRGISLREAIFREWRRELQTNRARRLEDFLKAFNADLYQECVTYIVISGIANEGE